MFREKASIFVTRVVYDFLALCFIRYVVLRAPLLSDEQIDRLKEELPAKVATFVKVGKHSFDITKATLSHLGQTSLAWIVHGYLVWTALQYLYPKKVETEQVEVAEYVDTATQKDTPVYVDTAVDATQWVEEKVVVKDQEGWKDAYEALRETFGLPSPKSCIDYQRPKEPCDYQFEDVDFDASRGSIAQQVMKHVRGKDYDPKKFIDGLPDDLQFFHYLWLDSFNPRRLKRYILTFEVDTREIQKHIQEDYSRLLLHKPALPHHENSLRAVLEFIANKLPYLSLMEMTDLLVVTMTYGPLRKVVNWHLVEPLAEKFDDFPEFCNALLEYDLRSLIMYDLSIPSRLTLLTDGSNKERHRRRRRRRRRRNNTVVYNPTNE